MRWIVVVALILLALGVGNMVRHWNDPQQVTVVKKEVNIGEDCWK